MKFFSCKLSYDIRLDRRGWLVELLIMKLQVNAKNKDCFVVDNINDPSMFVDRLICQKHAVVATRCEH